MDAAQKPEKISHWLIDSVLGSGATSVVYRAHSGSTQAAVKVLRSEVKEQSLQIGLQYRKEAVSLARLKHPRLVKIIEIGEWAEDVFVAMELIEWPSLDKVVGSGPMEESKIIYIAQAMADVLSQVHRIGLVHRDIKPQNILYSGQEGIKLIDFGFAAEIAKSEETRTGTLAYCPPEQSGLINRSVDNRSDLYSLGAVLFECCTGRLLFGDDNWADIASKQTSNTIPSISDINPKIGKTFALIIEKLLQQNPDDRYQSAEGLLADLENIENLKSQVEYGASILDKNGLRGQSGQQIPLIGRVKEYEKLWSGWEQALTGKGSVFQIEGEGGLGKTRLTQEVIAQIPNLSLFAGKCQFSEEIPFASLRESLDDWVLRIFQNTIANNDKITAMKSAGKKNASVLGSFSRGLRRILNSSQEIAVNEDITESAEKDSQQSRYYQLIADFFIQLVIHLGPTLLVVDDVQWADQGTLEVLKRINRKISELPLVIMLTVRNEKINSQVLKQIVTDLALESHQRIVLRPLIRWEIEEFLSAYLGGETHFEGRLIEKLEKVTKGNIFALSEYVRSLLECGALVPSLQGWQVNDERFDHVSLSSNAVNLVLERLKTLSPETLDILTTSALNGRQFESTVLAEATGNSLSAIAKALEEARRALLVERRGIQTYSFVHDRICEALIERLPADELEGRHQALAYGLDSIVDPPPDIVFSLARHYSLGRVDSNLQRIFEVCLNAGKLAQNQYAYKQAFALLKRAFSALGKLSEEVDVSQVLELTEALGTSALSTGNIEEAKQCFDRLSKLTMAESGSDADIKIKTLQCQSFFAEGDLEQTMQVLQTLISKDEIKIPQIYLKMLTQILLLTEDYQKWSLHLWRKCFNGLWSYKNVDTDVEIFYFGAFFTIRFFQRLKISTPWLGNLAALFSKPIVKLICKKINTRSKMSPQSDAAEVNKLIYSLCLQANNQLVLSPQQLLAGLNLLVRSPSQIGYPFFIDHILMNLRWRGCSKEIIESYESLEDSIFKTGNILLGQIAVHNWIPQLQLCGRTEEALSIKKKYLDIAKQRILPPFAKALEFTELLATLLLNSDPNAQADQIFKQFLELNFIGDGASDIYVLFGALKQQLVQLQNTVENRANLKLALDILNRKVSARELTCHGLIWESQLGFEKNSSQAFKLLSKADRLAQSSQSSWAHYEVAMQSARLYFRFGNIAQANTFAMIAYSLAEKQGWRDRCLQVKKEFPFEIGSTEQQNQISTFESKALKREAQFEALLRVSLASSGTLDLKEQAKATLDEAIKVLNADRAFLFEVTADGSLLFKAGRDADSRDLVDPKGRSQSILVKVLATKQPQLSFGNQEREILSTESAMLHNLSSIIASPIIVRDRVIGVLYLDSRAAKGLFTENEAKLLFAICGHIGIAFESASMAVKEVERREMAKDLALASMVQSMFLPKVDHLVSEKFELSSLYQPATQCSGDWWWHHIDKDGNLYVLLGDVTGHGAAPSMLTALVSTQVYTLLKSSEDIDLQKWLTDLNDCFRNFAQDKFTMSMSAIKLNSQSMKLQYWNAGAPEIFLCRPLEKTISILESGTLLGSEDFELGYDEFVLEPSTTIFLCTDGITELEVGDGQQLGLRRLWKILSSIESGHSAEQIATQFWQKIKAEVKTGLPFNDDATFVTIRVK